MAKKKVTPTMVAASTPFQSIEKFFASKGIHPSSSPFLSREENSFEDIDDKNHIIKKHFQIPSTIFFFTFDSVTHVYFMPVDTFIIRLLSSTSARITGENIQRLKVY